MREPAPGRVVVKRERREVRSWIHADGLRPGEIVDVQYGKGLIHCLRVLLEVSVLPSVKPGFKFFHGLLTDADQSILGAVEIGDQEKHQGERGGQS